MKKKVLELTLPELLEILTILEIFNLGLMSPKSPFDDRARRETARLINMFREAVESMDPARYELDG